MSIGARYAIAVVGVLAAIAYLCIVLSTPTKVGPIIAASPAAFLLLIPLASLPWKYSHLSGRILAAAIFVICLLCLVPELRRPDPGTVRAPLSLRGSILFALLLVASGYYAVRGSLPISGKSGNSWGKGDKDDDA